jgi:hypothetical protein
LKADFLILQIRLEDGSGASRPTFPLRPRCATNKDGDKQAEVVLRRRSRSVHLDWGNAMKTRLAVSVRMLVLIAGIFAVRAPWAAAGDTKLGTLKSISNKGPCDEASSSSSVND